MRNYHEGELKKMSPAQILEKAGGAKVSQGFCFAKVQWKTSLNCYGLTCYIPRDASFQARHSLSSMLRLLLQTPQLLLEGMNLQKDTDGFNEAADAMNKASDSEQFVSTSLDPQNEGVYEQHTGCIHLRLIPKLYTWNTGMICKFHAIHP